MEVDEIEFQNQVSKFQRVSSNTSTTTTDNNNNNNRANLELQKLHDGGITGIGWPSSRIVRVSRASGGKDRHSKVLTSKGLRDRRVRLSVSTAIQFYDLQDRLGYDQPSKAVEWLLQAAASSIDELPSLDPPFPVAVTGGDNVSQAKSPACSSTSETSKGSGSGLSLSRSENRNKARERARVRVRVSNPVNNMTENSSFTDLLTGGININSNTTTSTATTTAAGITSRSPMDYFFNQNHQFSFLQDSFAPAVTTTTAAGGGSGGGGGSYNLNFAMTSSSTGGGPVAPGGYNRGTLQSNLQPSLLPHHHHHHHLQSSAIDGSTSTNLPFFIGTNATVDHYPASGGYHINYSGDHHKEKSKN